LARFRVRKCGINELEQTAMAISNQQISENIEKHVDLSMMDLETWQAAIFKVYSLQKRKNLFVFLTSIIIIILGRR